MVTGLRPDGVSEFAISESVEPDHTYAGLELFPIWQAELPFELPIGGGALPERQSPASGNVNVVLVRYLPGQSPDLPFTHPHWHDTVDVQIVISGEIVQGLDDGSDVTLRPGDVVIQTGTSHSWEVRSEEGALVALVMHSATRVGLAPSDDLSAERVLDPPTDP
jgi:quercetin dioxygenase-like cupin family protein